MSAHQEQQPGGATSGAQIEGQTSESPKASLARFAPDEEAALLQESNGQKAQANRLYSSSDYSQAVGQYDKALASCPVYLEYEIAVLKANVAACHLQLQDWKAAVESATAALDALERLAPTEPSPAENNNKQTEDGKKKSEQENNNHQNSHHNKVIELEGNDKETDLALQNLATSDQRQTEIQKIRIKALMRRAKAKAELGGWANLQGAEDDYKTLSSSSLLMPNLSPSNARVVQAALMTLPSKIAAARDKEMGEMMGKLKELGNGLLRPFGLSTDNFNMVKDEGTGGYSMNFNQKR